MQPAPLQYGYRVDGPMERHLGLLFDPKVVVLDPYAKGVLAGKAACAQ
jgi:pullulanase/glycogen debranching enzyme